MGLVTYTAIIVCTRHNLKRYSAMLDFEKKDAYRATVKELKLFLAIPVCYFAINLIPFVARIINDIDDSIPLFGLWVAAAIVQGLQGVFITLLVALDPETRKRAAKWKSIRSAYKHNILQKSDTVNYTFTVGDSDSKN